MSDNMAERHTLHWLPNALTVSRILLIPVLVLGIIYPFHFRNTWGIALPFSLMHGALILFIICMITDFLDGYFARKWEIVSDFGRMLDPIADKLLVAACLISICIVNLGAPAIVIPALIIIGRDIFVSGIREHAANSNIILSPTKLAKWKTTFEMIAILLFMLSVVFPSDVTHQSVHITTTPNAFLQIAFKTTLWLAAILSAYTGFHYFRSAMRKG